MYYYVTDGNILAMHSNSASTDHSSVCTGESSSYSGSGVNSSFTTTSNNGGCLTSCFPIISEGM